MKLKTKRLLLRSIEPGDWKRLTEIWADFGRSEYAKYDAPHSLDDAEAKIKAARWAAASQGREHVFVSVCLGDVMIGLLDFHSNEAGYECGYCFHSDYHGQGYAKESLRAMMDRLSDGRRTRFVVGTALDNTPSVRLLRSLGFSLVATEKVSFYRDTNGEKIWFPGGVFALEKP